MRALRTIWGTRIVVLVLGTSMLPVAFVEARTVRRTASALATAQLLSEIGCTDNPGLNRSLTATSGNTGNSYFIAAPAAYTPAVQAGTATPATCDAVLTPLSDLPRVRLFITGTGHPVCAELPRPARSSVNPQGP